MQKFGVKPFCFVADNCSAAVRANALLADWNEEINIPQAVACATSAIPANANFVTPDGDDEEADDEHDPPSQEELSKLRSSLSLPTESIGCHCHALELVIGDGLEATATLKAWLADLRTFVTKYRLSSKTRAFIAASSTEKTPPFLPIDVSTRWSSTFRMIDAFVLHKTDFMTAVTEYRQNGLLPQEYPGMEELTSICAVKPLDMMVNLQKLLRPIAAAVQKLEGDSYPTISWVQRCAEALLAQIERLLIAENAKTRRSDTFITILQRMRTSLHKRFIMPFPQPDGYVPIDFIAAALDPLTKTMTFLDPPARELVWQHVITLATGVMLPEAVDTDIHLRASEETQDDAFKEYLELIHAPTTVLTPAEEVASYRAAPPTGSHSLEFWKVQEALFPRLALLARNYLAVPASSATVERVFSRAGNVVTNKRVLLGAEVIEAQTIYRINQPFVEAATSTKKRKRSDEWSSK